ncbi:hypothetical protein EMIHUDRAFT_114220 [Emiliania huxleyi CCMP1516]|uniref:Ataxin-10 domain-containing protein n=3 Tax=Emiliania huxleyi TaxID=2903 RepID=A0A0D3JXR1_EMIH1|nr:hypothetical protein EMIHUDRAFT_114220 [Emiliania huxleyi CCMP1516]EOD28296.1 hypothetical protein EMIHUDRAFT_114220 [Emiliania huxleyi CCMP1516]|eukprot:XP_005780725.1 hypothetical protein EMIHUDRAFT_114220 [Emiliania huxleyi CCMP1516]
MNAHAHSHVAVALAGPSGSGKSTLAVTLAAALRHEGVRVTLLHQDSYFRLPKPASYWSTPPEHDTPAAVDMERLAEDVRAAGRPPPEPDEAARGAEQLQIVLVEGFLLLQDEPLLSLFDSALFLRVDREACLRRRLQRSTRSESEQEGCRRYFLDVVWPTYERITLPALDAATLPLSAVAMAALRELEALAPPAAAAAAAASELLRIRAAIEAEDAHELAALLPAAVRAARESGREGERLGVGLAAGFSRLVGRWSEGGADRAADQAAAGQAAGGEAAVQAAAGQAAAAGPSPARLELPGGGMLRALLLLCRLMRSCCASSAAVQDALLEAGALARVHGLAIATAEAAEAVEAAAVEAAAAAAAAAAATEEEEAAAAAATATAAAAAEEAAAAAAGVVPAAEAAEAAGPGEEAHSCCLAALQLLSNACVQNERAQEEVWSWWPRLLAPLIVAGSGGGGGEQRKRSSVGLAVLYQCVRGHPSRLKALVSGPRAARGWLSCCLCLLRDGVVGAEASWGALLLSSLVAGGLLPDLLAAAAALRHPGARLELAVALQRLSEQVPPLLDDFSVGGGRHLAAALAAQLPLAASRAWWEEEEGAREAAAACPLSTLALLRAVCALAARLETPFSDFDDDAAALGLVPPVVAVLSAMAEWNPPAGLAAPKDAAGAPTSAAPPPAVDTRGAELELVRLLALLCFRRHACQKLAGEPFVREWALLAVRNLTEGCAENQATIAGLKQLSTPTLRVPPGEG